MPTSAWIMFIFGSVILYGGLALCIGIAVRSSNKKKAGV
ncbi:MAG: MetS family NSS transporter small subunit [Planctomycetes bacterium]|nr:MetS family NSS transporter small subunit [Planctomycetota bacterium]